VEFFPPWIPELLKALAEQTAAINKLVESNRLLIQAMAETEEDEEEPSQYLDGSSANPAPDA
jgi:uncharacterized coiled-coil protein SlyX